MILIRASYGNDHLIFCLYKHMHIYIIRFPFERKKVFPKVSLLFLLRIIEIDILINYQKVYVIPFVCAAEMLSSTVVMTCVDSFESVYVLSHISETHIFE